MERRRGRPLKPDTVAKRTQFAARIRVALREKLQAAATANGRTVSEEAEFRLEESFLREGMLVVPEALRLTATFVISGQHAGGYEGIAAGEWPADGRCYETAALAVLRMLWAHHPKREGVKWAWREWFIRAFDYVAGFYAPDDATRNDLTITAPRAGDFQAGRYDRERGLS